MHDKIRSIKWEIFEQKKEFLKLINERDKNLRSPIYFALVSDKYELVELLLSNGASTVYRDKFGRTLLHYLLSVNLTNRSKLLRLIIDYTKYNEKSEIDQ